MIQSTLTDRWQTTIPAKVRKALHLKPRQRLIYELMDGAVLVRPQPKRSRICMAASQMVKLRPPNPKSGRRRVGHGSHDMRDVNDRVFRPLGLGDESMDNGEKVIKHLEMTQAAVIIRIEA